MNNWQTTITLSSNHLFTHSVIEVYILIEGTLNKCSIDEIQIPERKQIINRKESNCSYHFT